MTELAHLAVHQNLNDEKDNINISKNIDLKNRMLKISEKDKYNKNYRIIFCSFPLTIAVAVGTIYILFPTVSDVYSRPVIELYCVIIFSAVLLSLCLLMIIWGTIKSSIKSLVNQTFGFEPTNVTKGNGTETLFEFEQRQYIGLWLLASFVISSVYGIINATLVLQQISYHIAWFMCFMPLSLNMMAFIFHKTVKCNQQIMQQKESILQKYKNTQIIEHKIKERLEDWKESKKLKNRKIELFCIFIVLFFVYYVGIEIVMYELYESRHSAIIFIVTTVAFIADCVFVTYLIYFIDTIYYHYRFPSIIMDELADPINAKTTDELIGWWQLRKFYARCIVTLYTPTLSHIIGLTLLTSIVITILLIYYVGGSNIVVSMLLSLFFCYLVFVTFLMVSNATNYHSNQLEHKNMICTELMALRKYKGDKDKVDSINNIYELELRKYENEIQHYVATQMIQDIQNNSHVINVMGISIDAKFMLLLRAGLGTAVIVIMAFLEKT